MNWDEVERDWKQFKTKVKEKWVKLSDDELNIIEGKKDRLARKIQEKYGIAKEEAEKQLHDFLSSHESDKNEDHE